MAGEYLRFTRAGGRRDGPARAHEGLAFDAIDARSAPAWRKGEPQRTFGEPVDRCQRLGLQSVRRKPRREAAKGCGADGLGPIEKEPQRTEVEPGELFVADAVQAQLEGKIGAR